MRTAEDLFAKCERDGEETVRKRFAEKRYCTHDEIPIVEEWLRRKDEERTNASISEELRLTREANSFAREANLLAKKANTIALIALIVAIIAIIVSVITLF